MKKSKFTESQIIKALKENEQGRKVGDISREMGIDTSTFYYWRKKYGDMEVAHMKRLKELEEENRKLKQMYADASLDIRMLKDVLSKKVLGPSDKKQRAKYLQEAYSVCVSRSCEVLDLARSMWYYHSRRDDTEVVDALSKLAEELPTRGFEVYYKRLRREGRNWNRKRVLRVYRSMNLKLRRKHKKRLPARTKNPLEAPMELNEVWSMDFMADVLSDGRKIRVFNVMDDCNREALAMDVGLNYPAIRVVETLSQLEEEIGLPKTIRCDNGPEFISKTLSQWCKGKRVELQFIQPGKPMQNGYMERLNRFYREDVLDAYWFNDLHQVRTLTQKWMEDYNTKHPHSSIGDMPPREYKNRFGEEFFPETDNINDNFMNLAMS